jgi:hypothetical protein
MVPSVGHAGIAQTGFDLGAADPVADAAVSHAESALSAKAALQFLAVTVRPRGWGRCTL